MTGRLRTSWWQQPARDRLADLAVVIFVTLALLAAIAPVVTILGALFR